MPKETCKNEIFELFYQLEGFSNISEIDSGYKFRWRRVWEEGEFKKMSRFSFSGKVTFEGNNKSVIKVNFEKTGLYVFYFSFLIIIIVLAMVLFLFKTATVYIIIVLTQLIFPNTALLGFYQYYNKTEEKLADIMFYHIE